MIFMKYVSTWCNISKILYEYIKYWFKYCSRNSMQLLFLNVIPITTQTFFALEILLKAFKPSPSILQQTVLLRKNAISDRSEQPLNPMAAI